MLMVVFGAGASYDSMPARPAKEGEHTAYWQDRPPLANELFDPEREEFLEVIKRFPKCQPVIPYLQRPADGSVERVLERLQTEAQEDSERRRQLAAIRFYLHFMLWDCEERWKKHTAGVTNYKTLLDQIRRWRKGAGCVCLVTFNYDRLLEDALPTFGVNIRALSDYIATEFKIIKLHGSVNWAHEVETPRIDISNRGPEAVANELIDRITDLTINEKHEIVSEHLNSRSDSKVLFPALTIPVETKQDYECPREHVDALRDCIPELRKLLVIGWSATENQFLQLLRDNLRGNLQVMVVASGQDSATTVINRLKHAGIRGEFSPASGGFSDLVVHRETDAFLQS